MPYIIPFVLILLGFVRPKDKWVTLLFLVYMWALVGLNTYTPDWESYETKYETFLLLEDYEIGHQGLILGCNYLGFSYQEYRMVYGFLMAMFSFIAVKRLSPYPNYLLALFLLWPFVGSASGLRQGLANIIVCCGIPSLYKDGKKHILFFILWIVLAWTIHRSTLFFLLLLFARCRIEKREKRLIIIATGVGVFIIGSTQILGNIPFIADHVVLNKWLNMSSDSGADHQNMTGFIVRAFFVVCYAVLIPRLASIIKRHAVLNDFEMNRLKVCSNISIILFLSVPGYIVSGEYQRLLYAMLLVYYVVYADFHFKRFVKPYPQRGQMLIVSIGLVLLTAMFYMYSMTSHDVLATFKDNLLFK